MIHEGYCASEFLKKIAYVSKVGMKFYILFHVIPLFLRLKRAKNAVEIFQIAAKNGLD
jgi:hypothetical protein